MEIHFTVCEDEKEQADRICSYIESFCKAAKITPRIIWAESGEHLLEHYPKQTDILFLDIAMGKLNGIETARRLREDGRDVLIIFITAMAQYAIEGYRVRAFSFLTKPGEYEEFRLETEAAVRKIKNRKGKVIQVKNYQDVYNINVKDLYYAEVQNHKIILHRKDSVLSYQGNLSALEEEIGQYGFGRCHVGYLVSFDRIKAIQGENVLLQNGEQVPVSRNRKKQFLQAMTEYAGRKER